MKKRLFGSSLLLLTAIIWGFAFVAQVEGMAHISSLTYSAIRFLIGASVLVPFIFIFSRKRSDAEKIKRSFLYGMIGGLLLFVPVTLQQFAIEFSPDENSMKAGFITGLYIVLVPIAYLIFMKKKTPMQVWIGAVCAVIGLYFLCEAGSGPLHFTDILLFLSVPIWTAQILFINAIGNKTDIFAYSVSQYAFCGVISLIGALIFERGSLFNSAAIVSAIIPILYGGVCSVSIAYTLQIVGQKYADPTSASIIMSTESMFSCIGNLLLLEVNMSLLQYVGCGLIFSGIILSQLVFKKRKETQLNKM